MGGSQKAGYLHRPPAAPPTRPAVRWPPARTLPLHTGSGRARAAAVRRGPTRTEQCALCKPAHTVCTCAR